MSPKMLLIDGHALAYRAFYATSHSPHIMSTSKGEWTNAVYVFVNKLLQVWREEQPEYIVVAFDVGATFRHEQYPEYKATRAKTPDELHYQVERIKQVVDAFNIPVTTCQGYEADDVLGTLSRQAATHGVHSIILTGDTDILQLVDDQTSVLLPRGRSGEDMLYGPDQVLERFDGLTPSQLVDFKALSGDTSDNIPGLKGIGKKTASSLLKAYQDVEGIYDHLGEIKGKRARDALQDRRQDALLYKDLVTIRLDAPVVLDLEHAKATDFDLGRVAELFDELEFHSMLSRIPEGHGHGGDQLSSSRESDVETRYTTVDTLPKLTAAVAELKGAPAFAFDTETTSTDAMTAALVGISWATAPGKAWYLPVGHGSASRRRDAGPVDVSDLPLFAAQEPTIAASAGHEDVTEESTTSDQDEPQLPLAVVVQHIKPIFENPAIEKYAHNASYDVAVLSQAAGIVVRGLAFDTMIAAWVIDPASRSLGLKPMALERLGVEMTPISELIGSGKSQITMDRVSIAQCAPYACADADMTWRLVEPLSSGLCERQQWDLFTEIEMPLAPILTQMEMVGVRLDVDYLRQMSKQLDQDRREAQAQIHSLAGHKFNVNSTQQLSQVLFEELDLPKKGIRKTTRGYSTAADVLALLKGKHPIIELILEYRQIAKLQSTYVDSLPRLVNPRTGRVHTSYNQAGAVTGRLSSSNPNLQNIPIRTPLGRQIRRGFVSEEGWVFLGADYSQIELRVLAHVSQDAELLDAFHKDQDVHARTAAAVYDVPLDQVSKEQRRIAKTVNFGLIYGQSAYGLSRQTELDLDEAERFISTYFARYPGVKAWLDGTRKLAYTQGHVETLLGRRRYFPELNSTVSAGAGQRAAAERQAINAPIQGTAADILKIAMIHLERELRERGLAARMVLQVHDEVILETPRTELERVLTLTRDVLENAYPLVVPLKVDLEIGEDWCDMEPAQDATAT